MKRILYIIYIMVATLAVTLFGGCEEQVFEYDFINNAGEEPAPTPTPTPGVNAKNVIYYTSTDGKVVTPNKDAFGVSIVSNTYTNGKGTITFSGTVTKIGEGAFYNCSSLTNITIPNGVTSIGNKAFNDCASLKSVTIPNSVTSIGYDAFAGCSALTSVTIPNSVTSIGSLAFGNCTSLKSVTIPNSVTEIGDGAFRGCTSLKGIYGKFASEDNRCLIVDGVLNSFAPAGLTSYIIPNSVTSIGDWVFFGCTSLTSVTIPNSVTSIGSLTFSYCSKLAEVYCKPTTPPTLGGSSVFDNNATDRKIYVPSASVDAYKAATNWSEYADQIVAEGSSTTEYVIEYTSSDGNVVTPNKTNVFGANIVSNVYENGKGVITFDGPVTTIGKEAFYECSTLASITIPDSVTTIGEKAFYKGSTLASITIPNSVTSIGYYAFYSCTSLTSVTIPNSVTSIDSGAFYSCRSLTSVTIPNSVTEIGNGLFRDCTSLKSIYGKFASEDNRCLIVNGVLNSFAPAGLTTYSIPASVTSIGNYAFYCSGLTSVTIPNGVTSIGTYAFGFCSGLTSVTIPNSVTSVGNYAFYGCASLTSVTIPNGVTSIGDNAFNDCRSLTSVTIPNSVTEIGNSAFEHCTSLSSVTIPESVTSIGDDAFGFCSGLTSVTIPNSVTSIGSYTFRSCTSLSSITIPNSVTSIEHQAFYGCSKLAEVYCKPTTPPILGGSSVFDSNASDRKIYVPSASVDAYKTATNWSEYASQIVAEGSSTTEYVIEYTSTDGAIVTPNTNADFGANIVSNVYENGKGVITFDGPVTKIASITNTNLDGAFYNCKTLKSITIPESVTLMEDYPFIGCSSLSTVNITDLSAWCRIDFANALDNPLHDVGKLHLNGSAITSLTIPSDITEIKKYAFYGYTSLTDVTIHNKVTSIGSYAFDSCGLASVTIPESVTSAESAFNGCTSLVAFYGKYATDDNRCLIINGKLISFAIGCGATSYTIPDNVTSIGKCAFSSCSSLTNIVIPNKVTSIGSSAFYDCTSLTNVTIGSGVTSIGSSAFEWCSSLTNVFIPDSVTSIGGGAFWGCKSLTSATIGSGVTTIHNQAFQACSSLSTVNISDLSAWCRIDFADSSSNPLYISEGKLCLNGSEITSLTIPSNITKIKKYTFYKCSSLTDVTIHDKVTSIGNNAFYSCSKLAEVYCKPTTPPTLGGSSVFDKNASDRKIYVPSASVDAYKTASNWSEYASQIVAE